MIRPNVPSVAPPPKGETRYKLTISYDGTTFHGFAKNRGVETVEGLLNQALQKILGKTPTLTCAGRTDAGVHAANQMAHIDLEKLWDEHTVKKALNFYLSKNPISVLEVKIVERDFHARFSAVKRHYIYKIYYREASLTFERNQYWCIHYPLDEGKMKFAAKFLIGKHDFTTFRSSNCQASSPVRTLKKIKITKKNEKISFILNSQSFLKNQVRSIIGCLKYVSENKWEIKDLEKVLKSKNRKYCAPPAPACGLYLQKIIY